MAEKFTRTQEKQYSGWVTYPKIGTHIAPGSSVVTTKDKPWVLATPNGIRTVSPTELAAGFLFKTDKGTEPINLQTVNARMVNKLVPWVQVVRNTAVVAPVMARHVPGKANGGLGHFEVYPEQYGPQFMSKIPGNVFVRMYSLQGGLKNIATPEQAAAVTPKPTYELVDVKAAAAPQAAVPKTNNLDALKAVLKEQLQAVVKEIGAVIKARYAQITVSEIAESTDASGTKFIRGDLECTFTFSPAAKGVLYVPVVVTEKDTAHAIYNILPKGISYGVTASGKKKLPLTGLAKPLAEAILGKAFDMRDAIGKAPDEKAQIESVVKSACDALKDKVAPMKYTGNANGVFEIVTADGSMGTVTCVVKKGNPYSCAFIVRGGEDNCPAARAVRAGLIPAKDTIADLKGLASAIVTGFARIKRQGITPVTAPVKESKYEYRLIGRGKDPTTGEQLYVLERIATGARTTMNRPQLIRLLEEKRVENAWVRWYKNDRQIRLRSKGGLSDMDVSGIRRSSLNRVEGAQTETTVIYSEVIKHLAKKGFTAEGDLEVSEESPIFGKFAVVSPAGHTITAMFSPTEWKYGATDGNKVNLKGTLPEDKRRRSMLASYLVSLIVTAAKNAVTARPNSTAPIIPAQDDDFSNPDELMVYDEIESGTDAAEAFDKLEEAKAPETVVPDAVDAFNNLEEAKAPETAIPDAAEAFDMLEEAKAPETAIPDAIEAFENLEEAKAPVGVDVEDAFAGLEDASVPDSSVTPATPTPVAKVEDPRIAQVEEILIKLVAAADAITSRVDIAVDTVKTSAECIQAGDEVMELTKTFDKLLEELSDLVDTKKAPYLPEFDEPIATATTKKEVVRGAVQKLGTKLQELQKAEAEAEAEAQRQAAELQHQTQEEADRLAAEAEEEAMRLAAEAESQRLAEDEDIAEEVGERERAEAEVADVPVEEEDPFAGLGDDIDTIFRNLPGEIVSEGK